jgi:hypothetical protein
MNITLVCLALLHLHLVHKAKGENLLIVKIRDCPGEVNVETN